MFDYTVSSVHAPCSAKCQRLQMKPLLVLQSTNSAQGTQGMRSVELELDKFHVLFVPSLTTHKYSHPCKLF